MAVDVQNIVHIAGDRPTIGDEVQDIIKAWGNQREVFSQQTPSTPLPPTPSQERGLQREQPMSLPSGEAQVQDDDNELQHTSFMQLLLGNESPQANGDVRHNPGDGNAGLEEEEDTESEFAKELESELFQDF